MGIPRPTDTHPRGAFFVLALRKPTAFFLFSVWVSVGRAMGILLYWLYELVHIFLFLGRVYRDQRTPIPEVRFL